jgi:secreted PhoX family phosphatase
MITATPTRQIAPPTVFVAVGAVAVEDHAPNEGAGDEDTAVHGENAAEVSVGLEGGDEAVEADGAGMSIDEILVYARLATDRVGATKMYRPEDIEPNPHTGKIYVRLTNNTNRGGTSPADEADPRTGCSPFRRRGRNADT